MLDLFAMLKKGYCDKTKVRIGRLQNLISSSCIGNNLIFNNYINIYIIIIDIIFIVKY